MKKLSLGGKLPLDRYRQLMDDSPIVTVDIMVLSPDHTRLLLGRRTNEPYKGVYFSFGGRLYKNEEFLDAAQRIAKQELGISILPSQLTFAGVTADFGDSSIFSEVNYHSVDIYYVYTTQEESVSLDGQHSDTQWFELHDSSLHPYVLSRIEGIRRVLKDIHAKKV